MVNLILGPAGTVHMCIADWARFAMLHVDGKVGEQTFLSAETLDRLHQPGPGQDYAMGWIVAERPWGQGRVLTHGGSNTMWMCTIWVAPKTGTAYLAATNVADGGAAGKVDQIIGQLISLDRG